MVVPQVVLGPAGREAEIGIGTTHRVKSTRIRRSRHGRVTELPTPFQVHVRLQMHASPGDDGNGHCIAVRCLEPGSKAGAVCRAGADTHPALTGCSTQQPLWEPHLVPTAGTLLGSLAPRSRRPPTPGEGERLARDTRRVPVRPGGHQREPPGHFTQIHSPPGRVAWFRWHTARQYQRVN